MASTQAKAARHDRAIWALTNSALALCQTLKLDITPATPVRDAEETHIQWMEYAAAVMKAAHTALTAKTMKAKK